MSVESHNKIGVLTRNILVLLSPGKTIPTPSIFKDILFQSKKNNHYIWTKNSENITFFPKPPHNRSEPFFTQTNPENQQYQRPLQMLSPKIVHNQALQTSKIPLDSSLIKSCSH